MGNLLSSYKKAIFDEVANSISSNTSQYYAFASNPISYTANQIPVLAKDDYSSVFEYNWNMIFGKKLTVNDIMPVIKKNLWVSGKVYDRYDNTSNTMYDKDNYYVVTEPSVVGGSYHIFKCIDNANNGPSTEKPNKIQISNFITPNDKYEWRYITSISNELYNKFSTEAFIPVYANSTVSGNAAPNSGVDSVVVTDGGSDYFAYYYNGTVQATPNTTIIKIDNDASSEAGFYTNNAIYLFNNTAISSQLVNISGYIVNGAGKFVRTETAVNTSLILSKSTKYSIAPKVVFETDGDYPPSAIAVVNTSTNSIASISIYNTGSNISWANVQIVSSRGSGANAYAIVAPSGGHGSNPSVELNMKGYCVSFKFEGNNAPIGINYNKIGILKNPYSIVSSTAQKSSARYSGNTFSSLLVANVTHLFTQGEVVKGANSKAIGTVTFANSTQICIVGDKNFHDNEYISTSENSNVSTISIVSRGDVYTKDVVPLYVQNINNVIKQENQSESFKLIIKL